MFFVYKNICCLWLDVPLQVKAIQQRTLKLCLTKNDSLEYKLHIH